MLIDGDGRSQILENDSYARMLYKGNGIPRDFTDFSVYLKKGADNGIVNSMVL